MLLTAMEAGMHAKPDSQFFSINIFSCAWFQLAGGGAQQNRDTLSAETQLLSPLLAQDLQNSIWQHFGEKKTQRFSWKKIKEKHQGEGTEVGMVFESAAQQNFVHSVPPNRMSPPDRNSSRYISVCTGMKKSMSAHSYTSSISASEPSYEHRTPSSEPTQREKCGPNIDIWRVALVARKEPRNSHGKGLAKQACPPPAQARTRVSSLGTALKGHF